MATRSVAIIGAGPAGATAARLLPAMAGVAPLQRVPRAGARPSHSRIAL
jgi:flavin-dependent dehydrogenase